MENPRAIVMVTGTDTGDLTSHNVRVLTIPSKTDAVRYKLTAVDGRSDRR